jgi:hypothetical protein
VIGRLRLVVTADCSTPARLEGPAGLQQTLFEELGPE